MTSKINYSLSIYNYIKDYILSEKVGPSFKTIAQSLHFSEDTVKKYIRVLENQNYIIRYGTNDKNGKYKVYPRFYKLPLEQIQSLPIHKTLKENKPEIYNRLDFEKLKDVLTELIPLNSNIALPFICNIDSKHKFTMPLNNMVRNNKFNCPYCSGRNTLYEESLEYYCIANNRPDILYEFSKQNSKSPNQYSINKKKAIKWTCPEHGDYWCSIKDKVMYTVCCPKCNNSGTSYIQFAIYYYLNKTFNCELNEKKNGFEFDITFEGLNLLIEYDSKYFHSTDRQFNMDNKKNDNIPINYTLIRIREIGCPKLQYNDFEIIPSFYKGNINDYKLVDKTIYDTVMKINKLFNIQIFYDINTQRDFIEISTLYNNFKTKNKVKDNFPEILSYLADPNIKDTLANLSFHSKFKTQWICANSNCRKLYTKAIKDRIKNTTHLCDDCQLKTSSIEQYANYNGFLKFDIEKNEKGPEKIYSTSKEKYWFKCTEPDCGITDLYSPDKVFHSGARCRHCFSKRKKLRKFTEVLKSIPYFEWDYVKNIDNPDDFFENSTELRYINDKRCNCDSFPIELKKITVGKVVRCPNKCSHNQYICIPLPGESFGEKYPESIDKWDTERNLKTPCDYTKSSGKKVFIVGKENPIAISDWVKIIKKNRK